MNVVRQTISKWEHESSVLDSDLLIGLSKALETPVSTLLVETVTTEKGNSYWKGQNILQKKNHSEPNNFLVILIILVNFRSHDKKQFLCHARR